MKICAYVQNAYSKANYKNECLDSRQFAGLRVIIDCLTRHGYAVEYAGAATVSRYDVVLVSLTSDCDWWTFIAERVRWKPGSYRVIIGGAGVLHITPFLPFGDYFMFGRGEDLIVPLVSAIKAGDRFDHPSVAAAETFSPDKIYTIAQASQPYPHAVTLTGDKIYQEGPIGCNHRCLFCGYTWHRKFVSPYKDYRMEDTLFSNIKDKELAMLDLDRDPTSVDFSHLRTTAIDGFSERIRKMVNKPITRNIFLRFVKAMLTSGSKPHQIKIYNILGYPTETEDDWFEFMETIKEADLSCPQLDKQWSIVLHSTPFRAMPATPMACAPMAYINFRGQVGKTLGPKLKGNLIYQGKSLWAVESMGTDSLASVTLSAIAHRGEAQDTDAIIRIASSKKFWASSMAIKQATLERYFDVSKLFGHFTAATLPSRYLRSYAKVDMMWPRE